MTSSSSAERGRGKRGPWELQADTLRAVQVSSSRGLPEKRRLICCPCFPREGGCRRKEEEKRGMGGEVRVSDQERMSHTERERERTREREREWVSTIFQNRLPNIGLLLLSPANGRRVLLSPLVPSPPLASSILPLQLFVPRNNGKSWHHDCKMFQFSFQQAFSSLYVCTVCVCKFVFNHSMTTFHTTSFYLFIFFF